MTFTVVARCAATRALGVCVATSSIGVSSRCPHVSGGIAAISSQCHTNPQLGVIGLELSRQGLPPARIIDALRSYDPHFEYRQIGIVDVAGNVAVHSGSHGKDYTGHRTGDGFVVMGNNLAGSAVIDAMHEAYLAHPDVDFEERLLRTVEGGFQAGGETVGQTAAGLIVALPNKLPRTRLQIDFVHPGPAEGGDAVRDLRRVFDAYKPFIPYYSEVWPDNPTVNQQAWLSREAPGHPP